MSHVNTALATRARLRLVELVVEGWTYAAAGSGASNCGAADGADNWDWFRSRLSIAPVNTAGRSTRYCPRIEWAFIHRVIDDRSRPSTAGRMCTPPCS